MYSPVWEKDNDVKALRLSDRSAFVTPEPAQSTAERTATASANEEAFVAHKEPDGSERLFVGRLQPFIYVGRIS